MSFTLAPTKHFLVIGILLLLKNSVYSLGVKNLISVRLQNDSYYEKIQAEFYTIPDIEKLFQIKAADVKKLRIENTQIDAIERIHLELFINLKTLDITYNSRLTKLKSDLFEGNKELSTLTLADNRLDYIAPQTFDGLFQNKNVRGTLNLQNNNLQTIPRFQREMRGLIKLILDDNPISSIQKHAFQNLTSLEELSIENTNIEMIPSYVFIDNPKLYHLDLRNNRQLERIDARAFEGAKSIGKLYLSEASIHHLPYKGLKKLNTLWIENTPNLWDIPDGLIAIATLEKVHVSSEQRFLCCAFEMKRGRFGTFVSDEIDVTPSVNLCKPTSITPQQKTAPSSASVMVTKDKSTEKKTEDPFGGFIGKRRKKRGVSGIEGFLPPTESTSNFTNTLSTATKKRNTFFPDQGIFINTVVIHSEGVVVCANSSNVIHYNELQPVTCTPGPDELRPCDDLMGNVVLTCLSWIVSVVALFGNSVVFCVLVLSRRTVTVTKFLLMNLSFADLCLALYLFILVSASAHTHGDYYNYVKEWQYGGGCSISGFLAIFSSQLSMLVLVVITIERYYAIVYAMHFHRRVTMTYARIAMMTCWIISIIVAILPILGINSYNEVAICLPFKINSSSDLTYIGFLLIMNVTFFIFVLASYIRMYCIVRSPHLDCGQQRNDSEVAKRMALLVFTDFFCWAPIAFVGLASAFGSTNFLGIDVKKSKYLLVIFFPINSLCNPFLYAVSTNAFKRDFYDLLLRCGLFQERISKINEGVYTNSVSQFGNKLKSDTMTYNTQLSRNNSSLRKKTTNGNVSNGGEKQSLLSKFVLKKSMQSSNELLDKQDCGLPMNLPDEMTDIESKASSTTELQHVSEYDNVENTFPALRFDEKSSPKTEVADDKCLENVENTDKDVKNDVENDDVFETSLNVNSNRTKSFNECSDKTLPTENKFRTASESDKSSISEPITRQTSGFSRYDLSQNAFKHSKETSVL